MSDVGSSLGERHQVARGGSLSRRAVLAGAASAAALSALGATWPVRIARALPVDPVTALLQAYASTLVPGPRDDPAGTPGAVEAGGVEELVAGAPYVVPLLVADLTGAALLRYGRDFASLSYPEREALVVDAFADGVRATHHSIALVFVCGAFYGDFRNRVGSTHLGFPGPSAGYLATFTDRTGHGQPEAAAIPP